MKDSMIADPTKCKFDPSALLCSAPDDDNCLTQPQVETVRKLYAGPANPRTGERIYPGIPRGSEFGWERLGPAPGGGGGTTLCAAFQMGIRPQWDWRSFDFDGSAAAFEKKLAGTVNATSSNLDGFRSHGGKLILYHGWADWLVAREETIRYYEAVAARDRRAGVNTGDSLRLFMPPGMAHCGGGPGADQFDPLSAMVEWVGKGAPPEKLVATRPANGKPVFRRVLCPFPQTAAYRGSGYVSDDHSYTCVDSGKAKRNATRE